MRRKRKKEEGDQRKCKERVEEGSKEKGKKKNIRVMEKCTKDGRPEKVRKR